jgi:hypothetical protein
VAEAGRAVKNLHASNAGARDEHAGPGAVRDPPARPSRRGRVAVPWRRFRCTALGCVNLLDHPGLCSVHEAARWKGLRANAVPYGSHWNRIRDQVARGIGLPFLR